MGRAIYSQAYSLATPVIHSEPEPTPACERWTSWSHFDPDSEEFFQDAEYEAFIDPVQRAREQAAEITSAALIATSPTGMSDLSDSISSEDGMGEREQQQQRDAGAGTNNSPMAVGADDPAMLIANAYTVRTARWATNATPDTGMDDQFDAVTNWAHWRSPAEPLSPPATNVEYNFYYSNTSPQQTTPAFIPPPSMRSPTLRRVIPITPITITRTRVEHRDTDAAAAPERSPSPASPGAPATPPPMMYRSPPPRAVRPTVLASPSSPPPLMTPSPQVYSWQRHRIPAMPVSPGAAREREREGPLTNPLARMSFVRIDAGPARVRIPNTVM